MKFKVLTGLFVAVGLILGIITPPAMGDADYPCCGCYANATVSFPQTCCATVTGWTIGGDHGDCGDSETECPPLNTDACTYEWDITVNTSGCHGVAFHWVYQNDAGAVTTSHQGASSLPCGACCGDSDGATLKGFAGSCNFFKAHFTCSVCGTTCPEN